MNSNHKTYAAPANSAKSDADTNQFIPAKKFAPSKMIGKENLTITGCMASTVNCRQSNKVKCLSTNPVKRPIGKKPNCRKRKPSASSVGAAKKKPNQTAGRNASVPPSGIQNRYNKTGRSEQKQSRKSKAGVWVDLDNDAVAEAMSPDRCLLDAVAIEEAIVEDINQNDTDAAIAKTMSDEVTEME